MMLSETILIVMENVEAGKIKPVGDEAFENLRETWEKGNRAVV